jgi:hypothetical protein
MTTNLKKLRDQLTKLLLKMESALLDADFHIQSLSNGARLNSVKEALEDLVKFYDLGEKPKAKKKTPKPKKAKKITKKRGKK